MDSLEQIQEELPQHGAKLIINGHMRLLGAPLEKPCAWWRGQPVHFSKGQYAVLRVLLENAGVNCASKVLYRCLDSAGYRADCEANVSTNMRSVIKRIKERICAIDASFSEIINIPGFGYRWGFPIKPSPGSEYADCSLHVGALDIYPAVRQIFWEGTGIPLTGAQVRVVTLLAANAGRWVHRRIVYDCICNEGFMGRRGEAGDATNARALIKSIRGRFRDFDGSFACIKNRPNCGYMWTCSTPA